MGDASCEKSRASGEEFACDIAGDGERAPASSLAGARGVPVPAVEVARESAAAGAPPLPSAAAAARDAPDAGMTDGSGHAAGAPTSSGDARPRPQVRFVDGGDGASGLCISDMLPQMDSGTARRLATEGGSVLCLGVPPGTEFGIDYTAWRTGERFQGVKLIPPGVHFLYYSAVGKLGNMAPRTGMFITVGGGSVRVLRWDPATETLQDERVLEPSFVESHAAGVRRFEFDASMGPYPLKAFRAWHRLSDFITPELVSRAEPVGGMIASSARAVEAAGAAAAGAPEELDGDRGAAPTSETVDPKSSTTPLFFTRVPGVGSGARPADITARAVDTTSALLKLIRRGFAGDTASLLGELQMSFVVFLLGQSLEAFEQWKHLVDTILRCEDALWATAGVSSDRMSPADLPAGFSDFIVKALGAVQAQLGEAPAEFFAEQSPADNFLYGAIRGLLSAVEGGEGVPALSVAPAIAVAARRLQRVCEKRFAWSFSWSGDHISGVAGAAGGEAAALCGFVPPDDEDGPVVVDLDAAMF